MTGLKIDRNHFFRRRMGKTLLALLMSPLFLSSLSAKQDKSESRRYMEARKVFNNTKNDSGYDMKIKNYKFPDGRVADAYVFNDSIKGTAWQDAQYFKLIYNGSSGSSLDIYFKVLLREDKDFDKNLIINSLFKKRSKVVNINPISYYEIKDIEASIPAKQITSESCIIAAYEDADGVYLLTFAPSARHVGAGLDKKTAGQHEGQLAYKVAYINTKTYEPINFTVPPAKISPIDLSLIPDSDKSIMPSDSTVSYPSYCDNDIVRALQWLTVEIACKGVYRMEYTGDSSVKDPTGYYTMKCIRRFYIENGKTTKGNLMFEGICFDYADFAVQELKKQKLNNISWYSMVGTFENPNEIAVYRIANSGEMRDMTINNTPVVIYTRVPFRAHGNTTNHAWVWVQATDGTVYWIDPTWTDNLGRPVYGIVRDGKEIQLPAEPSFCVN